MFDKNENEADSSEKLVFDRTDSDELLETSAQPEHPLWLASAEDFQVSNDSLSLEPNANTNVLSDLSKSGKHRAEILGEISHSPIMELLKPGRKSDDVDIIEQEQARVLGALFNQFDINATVVTWKSGPRVTRFEIEMGRGVKIDKISRLDDEIKYALGAHKVNVLSPIPGQSLVGIEVPRKTADIVSLGDVLRSQEANNNKESLLIGIGQDVEGAPVLADLGEMPHLLVAGATGSGKSCFINALICSILVRTEPDAVRLILIDPKRVELAQYKGIPHLALPVISDSANAIEALKWAVAEMEYRYQLFERHRVNRIDRYNVESSAQRLRYPNDPNQLPKLVIVIDELADLIKSTNSDAQTLIVKLTQQGRAAGIHMVVATQRPSVDVITGLIKANIPSRLAFATASQVDSRVILDTTGAENLSGKGDGLLMLGGIEGPRRILGALIDEDEIHDIVGFLANNTKAPDLQYAWTPSIEHIEVPVAPTAQLASDSTTIAVPESEETVVAVGIQPMSLLSNALGNMVLSTDSEDISEIEDQPEHTSTLIEFESFSEPDWREIIDLLERRIEPCDITGAMVDVSRKRKLWRSIERALSKVRVRVVQRLADRAEFRFKERIEQDEAISKAQVSLAEWTYGHSHSVAWQFHEQAIGQLRHAQNMRSKAIDRVESKISFRNHLADQTYAKFARSTLLPTLIGLYIYSVLVLTDKRFHFILKYFPPFNQGLPVLGVMVTGVVSIFIFKAMWTYTSAVRITHWDFIQAKKEYAEALLLISHAYEEEVRLEQQIENIEPLFEVLARGYDSRWVIDDSLNVDVSTQLDISTLPACVGFARAVNGPDDQIAKLQDLALRQVVRPGWRTELLKTLGEKYGEKHRTYLGFDALDRDMGMSMSGAKADFLAAFKDMDLAKRLGKTKLFALVNVIHNMVLRDTSNDLRPPVLSTRTNGFEDIDTSSAWLSEKVETQDWIEYLSEILQDAPPFSYLNLSGIQNSRAMLENVSSYAVLPKYLVGHQHESVQVETNLFDLIAPIDVAVRVDVSAWAEIDAFNVFETTEPNDLGYSEDEISSQLNGDFGV